jgi:hypothetical protein
LKREQIKSSPELTAAINRDLLVLEEMLVGALVEVAEKLSIDFVADWAEGKGYWTKDKELEHDNL